MANKQRGEAVYELPDGTKLPLVLGLKTLAELEDCLLYTSDAADE